MKDNAKRKEEQALFWYGIIAPLLDPDLPHGDRSRLIQKILDRSWTIPGSSCRKISRATLFRKLKEYRHHGFGGLKKQDRTDKGSCRRLKSDWLQKAIELRLEQPKRTTHRVIELTEKAFGLATGTIKLQTLSRIFKNKELTRAHLRDGEADPGGFTSFAHHHINELWTVDVMHAFPIPDPRDTRRRKMTYLVGIIDDASRLIPHAEFYFDEKLPRLENTLKKAISRRGIPKRLYCDHGQIFHAKQFELICAELGVHIVHSQPYRPEGRGKIERFFSTCQTDFTSEARAKGPQSLQELNTWFWAWLEMAYHHKIHSSLGTTPLAFWLKQRDRIRFADPDVLDTIFLWREDRLVSRVHTFHVSGNLYDIAPEFAGNTIEIRYNPFDLSIILVYQYGAYLCRAKPVSLPQPVHPKVPRPISKPRGPISMSYLDTLMDQYENHLKKEFGTLDFGKIESKRKLALEEEKGKFVWTLSEHIGRPLDSIETASARAFHDELGPIDPDALSEVPKDPVPDAIAFGKFLFTFRSRILSRRQPKGDR